jgi:probable rRNA maturation factor
VIEFSNVKELEAFNESIGSLITRVVDYAVKFEEFNLSYEISFTITDNLGIKEYNCQYRNIDRETDVLSFPMLEFDKKDIIAHNFKVSKEDENPENGNVVLGDIILSLEKAAQQALEYGHSFEREVAFLTVHSVLHLLGYDHMELEDEVIMRKEEEQILSNMNLSR